MVRVLQIVDNLGMGGAETWLMEVLRLWSGNGGGIQMDFLVTSGASQIFDDEARALGARIHYLRYGRRDLLRFGRGFRRLLDSGQYHAVHDHQDYSSGWHFLMGNTALPPIRVTHVHNPAYQIRHNYGVTRTRRITSRLGKALVARYATHIVGTSRQVIAEYGFDTRRFRRVPKAALYCGFDAARFALRSQDVKAALCGEFGWPADAAMILVAGRIDRSPDLDDPQNHKNSAFAVSVGIECMRHDARVRMLFAGAPTPAVPVLEERVAAAGFAGRVRFAGVRRDIERVMAASDLLLFPSRGEGLGMVAVEAQAAGLPVLASAMVPRECVVVPELVHFREVSAGAGAWATEIQRLLAHPRRDVGANARVAASAFAIEHSANALARLYSHGSIP